MEFSSEAGRSTLLPNGKGNSSVHTYTHKHTHTHECLHSCTDTHNISRQKTTYIHVLFRIHALVLSFSFSLFLRRFPVHTVYLSWYIQSMNTQSQQVWTQLLNIQPGAPSYSPFLSPSLVFSHLKLSLLYPLPSLTPISLYFELNFSLWLSTALPPLPLLSVLHFH